VDKEIDLGFTALAFQLSFLTQVVPIVLVTEFRHAHGTGTRPPAHFTLATGRLVMPALVGVWLCKWAQTAFRAGARFLDVSTHHGHPWWLNRL